MEHNHFVSVAGLVINDKEEVLLIKSPNRGWEYPGGMVEPGETIPHALIREIKEESGVDVEIIGFIGICKNIHSNSVSIDFVCRWIGGELATSEESIEVKWVKRNEAINYITYPLTKKRLEQMLSKADKVSVFCFNREPSDVAIDVITDDEFIVGC